MCALVVHICVMWYCIIAYKCFNLLKPQAFIPYYLISILNIFYSFKRIAFSLIICGWAVTKENVLLY